MHSNPIKSLLKSLIRWSPVSLTQSQWYDRYTKRIMGSVLQPDSNCIDVGCHRGKILDFMLSTAPEGTHYGFEPIPVYYEYILNKYSGQSNIHISDVALSDEKGPSGFNYVKTNPAYSGLKKRRYDRPREKDEQIEVRTDLLDHLIPEELSVDLIKIDVEGAEFQVLTGGQRTIMKNKPLVLFEFGLGTSDRYGTTPGMIFRFFDDLDMQIATLNRFLKEGNALEKTELELQYYDEVHCYFIAFPVD